MSSEGCNFINYIKLGYVLDGGQITFYHPRKKKCQIVTATMRHPHKDQWICTRYPRRENRVVNHGQGVQFVVRSTQLAAARAFYKQFEIGWFK